MSKESKDLVCIKCGAIGQIKQTNLQSVWVTWTLEWNGTIVWEKENDRDPNNYPEFELYKSKILQEGDIGCAACGHVYEDEDLGLLIAALDETGDE